MVRIALVTFAVLVTELAHAEPLPLPTQVRELAARHLDALDIEAGLIVPDVAEADVRWLPVSGPCIRPSAAMRAEQRRRIEPWLAKRIDMNAIDEPPTFLYGCANDGGVGVIVDLWRDEQPERHVIYLRVARTIELVKDQVESAFRWVASPSKDGDDELDSGAWTRLLGLVDLGGDARFEPIVVHKIRQQGVTMWSRVHIGRDVAIHRGGVYATDWQPEAGTLVVRLTPDDNIGVREKRFRCIVRGSKTLVECPAAASVQQWEARRELAEDARRDPFAWRDVASLTRLLDVLGITNERASLLALAKPSTLEEHVTDFLARRAARHAAQLDSERARIDAGIAARLDALVVTEPCLPVSERRAILDWIRRHEASARGFDEDLGNDVDALVIEASCGAPRDALVVASWEHGGKSRALFHIVRHVATPVLFDFDAAVDVDTRLPELPAKLVRRGDIVVAVAGFDRAQLIASGMIRRDLEATIDWTWSEDGRAVAVSTPLVAAEGKSRTGVPTLEFLLPGIHGLVLATSFDAPTKATLATPPPARDALEQLLLDDARRSLAEEIVADCAYEDSNGTLLCGAALRVLGGDAWAARIEALPRE